MASGRAWNPQRHNPAPSKNRGAVRGSVGFGVAAVGGAFGSAGIEGAMSWAGDREVPIFESARRSKFPYRQWGACKLSVALARIGTSAVLRERVEGYRAVIEREGRHSDADREYKASRLWAITAGARFDGERKESGKWRGTGALVLDFDGLGADAPRIRDAAMSVQQSGSRRSNTIAAFVSPGGDGVKVVVR